MKKTLSVLFILVIFLFVCRWVYSVDEYRTEDEEARAYNVSSVTKTVEGLNFRVEPDRAIEKIAGVYRPVDLDSYIAYKFNKLDKKIDALFAELSRRIDELTVRVDALEKKAESPQERIERGQNETQKTLP